MISYDPYHALTGKNHPTDATVLEIAEHGRVGGVSTGQAFKFVTSVDGVAPTVGNNPSLVLTYTNGNLTKVEKTIGATTYTKNLTYTDGNLTVVSVWS